MSTPHIAKKPRVTTAECRIAENAANEWYTVDRAYEHHTSIMHADLAHASQAQDKYVHVYNAPPTGSMPAKGEVENTMNAS